MSLSLTLSLSLPIYKYMRAGQTSPHKKYAKHKVTNYCKYKYEVGGSAGSPKGQMDNGDTRNYMLAKNSKANRRSSQLQPTTLVCMLRPTKPRKPAR